MARGAHGHQPVRRGAQGRFLVQQHRPGQRAGMNPAVAGHDPTGGEHAGPRAALAGGPLEQRRQRTRAGHRKPVEEPDPFGSGSAGRSDPIAASACRTRLERKVYIAGRLLRRRHALRAARTSSCVPAHRHPAAGRRPRAAERGRGPVVRTAAPPAGATAGLGRLPGELHRVREPGPVRARPLEIWRRRGDHAAASADLNRRRRLWSEHERFYPPRAATLELYPVEHRLQEVAGTCHLQDVAGTAIGGGGAISGRSSSTCSRMNAS